MIPFDKICELRDHLELGSDPRLLISLYTMIPPIRGDFGNMKVNDTVLDDPKGNYLVTSTPPRIILNEYKTYRKYSQIEIPIPEELMNELRASLDRKPRDYVFVNRRGEPYIRASFVSWADYNLKKCFGPDFSLSMFRHIYLSRPDLGLDKMTLGERKHLAHQMGHDVPTQMKYKWNLPSDES